MPVESEADRAAFTNATEFGVSATYQPKTGPAVSIAVLFDNNSIAIDPGVGMVISTVDPHCEVETSLLLNGGSRGETLTINSTLYTIRDLNGDGTGMTKLELQR